MTADSPIVDGDWVTNLDEMLGEPHEVIGITYEGLLVCAEVGGHVIQVSPWNVKKITEPYD